MFDNIEPIHKQTIADVCMIARNAIDRIIEPESNKPAQRPWQGLTDAEKKTLATAAGCTKDDDGHIVTEIFRLAEAALKELNT